LFTWQKNSKRTGVEPDALILFTSSQGVQAMIFRTTGLIKKGFHVLGLSWSPVFLLEAASPILFEAGFSCAAEMYEEGIRRVLKQRQPEMLFLTHVHWDHCGSAGHIQQRFPQLKIAASARSAAILARPNARKLMGELNRNIVPTVANMEGTDKSLLDNIPFRPFSVNFKLVDGQEIRLAKNLTVQALATPGHTWDHFSYYIPERKILIAGEAAGCLELTDYVDVQFLADCEAYMTSLRRLSSLPVEILCQGHNFVFVGRTEVKEFLRRSVKATEHYQRDILELLHQEKGSIGAVVARLKAERYDPITGRKQPEEAYLLNLKAQVAQLHQKHWSLAKP
jgi:glyoxylase-like metal-dependent hydrolase (beta-lactamase superfamily II)